MMELKETIDLMIIDDYKGHFKAEYYQLKIRCEKLQAMLTKWDNGELNFAPTCPRELYDRQVHGMCKYLEVLEEILLSLKTF